MGIKNQNIGFIWLILLGQLMLTFSRTAYLFLRENTLAFMESHHMNGVSYRLKETKNFNQKIQKKMESKMNFIRLQT